MTSRSADARKTQTASPPQLKAIRTPSPSRETVRTRAGCSPPSLRNSSASRHTANAATLLAADRGERDGRDVIRRLELERVRVASNAVLSVSEMCPMCRRVD